MNLNDLRQEMLKDPEYLKALAKKRDDYLYQLGRRIRLARASRGLPQAELARMIGTKQSAIARLENGRLNISIRHLEKIAAALKMKLSLPALQDVSSGGFERRSVTAISAFDCASIFAMPDFRKELNSVSC